MLLRSLKKMRSKCLMRVSDLGRWDVSSSNGDSYNPEVFRNATFICLKMPTRLFKTTKEENT